MIVRGLAERIIGILTGKIFMYNVIGTDNKNGQTYNKAFFVTR